MGLPETQVSPDCLVTINIHNIKGYGDDVFLTLLYLIHRESETWIELSGLTKPSKLVSRQQALLFTPIVLNV